MKYGRVDTRFMILLIFYYSFGSDIFSQTNYEPIREYSGQAIWDIDAVPEEKLDVGLWALVIAKEFDNSIDVEKYLKQLDEMTAEIKRMLAGRTKDIEKFLATRMYIYEAGIWNDDKPFGYDLDDPLGKELENQLLSIYLETRKGNCVSMPTLFLALMERVDADVPFTGVSAPLHLFCRLKDRQTGDVWNVETTNHGSPARNQWYIDEMNIPQTALESGLYLRDLSKKEFLAELINVLIRKERKQANYRKALEYAELVLKLNAKSHTGLVHKGALLALLGHEYVERGKATGRAPTEKDKKKLRWYASHSKKYIERAQALGWRPETQEQRARYLQMVEQAKKNIPVGN